MPAGADARGAASPTYRRLREQQLRARGRRHPPLPLARTRPSKGTALFDADRDREEPFVDEKDALTFVAECGPKGRSWACDASPSAPPGIFELL